MLNEKELIKLAYNFYPKGVSELDRERYNSSVENNNLRRAQREALTNNQPKWEYFLSQAREKFPDTNINSYEFYLNNIERSFPACLTFKIKSPNIEHTLNLCAHISILINSFVIYQSNPQKATHSSPQDYSSFELDDSLRPQAIALQELIQTCFKDYTFFPKKLLNIEVADIMFNGFGIMANPSSNVHPDFQKSMTLYNAFFSNNYYYNE